ncbi:MAG: hypothetical protein ACRDGW_07345 [Actinomycetota bacterium]
MQNTFAARPRPDARAEEAHLAMSGRRCSMAWVVGTLHEHEVPADEIRALIAADDPRVVRRYLELHRERLDERVAERRRGLASVERVLAAAILERRRRTSISA